MKMNFLNLSLSFLALVAMLSSCSKKNEKEIIADWTMSEIYIDNLDARWQYADEESIDCSGTMVTGTPSYFVDELKWSILEGVIISSEKGTAHNIGVDYCSNSYEESSEFSTWEGNWTINNNGKGDVMTIDIDGAILSVNIIELEEYYMIVEYALEGLNYRIRFSR